MPSWNTTLGPKGQITLPIEIRRKFDMKPKDTITVVLEGDEIRVESARARLRASVLKYPPGKLATPMTWAEVKASAREGMAQNVWDEMHPPDGR